MNNDRTDELLITIDKLGVTTIRQLQKAVNFGSYRNLCKIVKDHEEYLNVKRNKEKTIYLNKKGRDYIGSTNVVSDKQIEHKLMVAEAYLYYGKPITWETEKEMVLTLKRSISDDLGDKEIRIKVDARYKRNGYYYFIEVDNTQNMTVNKEKIEKYKLLFPQIKKEIPRLHFITRSEHRKKQLLEWGNGLAIEVFTLNEIN